MRLILCIILAGLLAACSQSGRGSDRGAVMAIAASNTVDLASADGVMFLQSSQTGFLEAPPLEGERSGRAPARIRDDLLGQSLRGLLLLQRRRGKLRTRLRG